MSYVVQHQDGKKHHQVNMWNMIKGQIYLGMYTFRCLS